MASPLFLGIDQSTQGTKAVLFDEHGSMVDKFTLPHEQIINDLGYVEHNLSEIRKNVTLVVEGLLKREPSYESRIKTAGISVQRETVGMWQKSTLRPLYNAVVWQCPRGAAFVQRPEIASKADRIREITGLELSEFFSAPKITWLMDNVPEAKSLAEKDDLCIGNMDSYVIACLTHGRCFATEPSNASRTMLLDIRALKWSEELCSLFKVPLNALPEIKDSDSLFGMTDFDGVLAHEIPIHSALGDSMGALFGHGCLKPGQIKTTFGTGSSIMMNAGQEVSSCLHGIVNSVGWRRQGRVTYALEGNINYSAGIISYLKDDLELISDPSETEALARAANPNDRCYFVPAFSGLGAPYFTGRVRGMICSMSRLTGKKELVRAALDSIAYQVADIVELVRRSAKEEVTELSVDGGATRNGYLMQMVSDLLYLPLKAPSDAELSAKGVALMAAIASGCLDESVLFDDQKIDTFSPAMPEDVRKTKMDGWHKAVKSALEHGL